jgi:hypothetical protein
VKPASGDDAASRRRAARACPGGLTISQCEALVEEIKQAKHSGSPSVQRPRDCLEVMSRAECEAMLAAQQAAAQQEGSPINLEECLQHPTPRCRAVLEPVLEAQYAASQQAAK